MVYGHFISVQSTGGDDDSQKENHQEEVDVTLEGPHNVKYIDTRDSLLDSRFREITKSRL